MIRCKMARYFAWITFLMLPLWTRWSDALPLFPSLYVTRFALLIPMLITIVFWLIAGAPGIRRLAFPRMRAVWALSLMSLALWGFASLSWAFMTRQFPPHPEVGETAALQLGVVVLFVIAVAGIELEPRTLIGALVLGLILNTAITIAQAAGQSWLGLRLLGEYPYSIGMSGLSILRAGDNVYLRPYGLMPHPNILAGLLMVGTLAVAAWLGSTSRKLRYGGAFIFAGGILAILLTFSRAAWAGVIVGGIVLLPFIVRRFIHDRGLRPPVVLTTTLVIVAGVWFLIHYQPFILARTGQAEESIEMRSIADRIVYTEFALRSIGERPLVGVGIGNFPWRTSYYLVNEFYDLRGDNVHNIYLSVWAELGTVGFVLYLVALISGIIAGIQAIRQANKHEQLTHAALLAIVIALMAIGWLDHYPYTILHLQLALWGCLAVAQNIGAQHTAPQ